MEKTCEFWRAMRFASTIKSALPNADLKTGYALRRTEASISAATKAALESSDRQVVSNYEVGLTAAEDREAYAAAHPQASEKYNELMSLEVSFQVFQLDASVLEKGWPQVGECGVGAIDHTVFCGLLVELDSVREE